MIHRFLILGLVALAAGCGGDSIPEDLIPSAIAPVAPGSEPVTDADKVLLITIDTLRADHLGCYGSTSAQTPAIDALAKRGVLFEKSFSHVPITLPAHTSILTGMLPCAHGVHDNGTYEAGDDLRTLPEILKEKGYSTGAVVGSFVLDAQFGLDQGFDSYDDDFVATRKQRQRLFAERQAEEVATLGMKWIGAHSGGPFFLWLHFFDPHMAYDPPEPFRSRFKRDLHAGEIAYTDYWIGKVLDCLGETRDSRGRSLTESTITILTSDHGEARGEHLEETHSFFIYQSTMHVPLIIHCPGMAAGRSKGLACGVDLAPTVLELLGIDAEPQIAGRSLVPAMKGAHRPRLCYMETEMPFSRGWAPLKGLTNGRWKYIEAPRPELYDLDTDPREKQNLVDSRSTIAERLRGELESLVEASRPENAASRTRDTTAEERKILEALGYMGGASVRNTNDLAPEDLPDPKDKAKVFAAVQNSWGLADAGRRQEALGLLRDAAKEDREYIEIYTTLGALCLHMGLNKEAIGAYEHAAKLDPESTLALNGAAAGYARENEFNKALEWSRLSMRIDRQNSETYNTVANIYLRMNDHDRALEECRAGLDADGEAADLHNTLGLIHMARNETDEAIGAFERATELQWDLWRAWYNLGRIQIQLKRPDEAVAALEEALKANPNDRRVVQLLGKAYFNGAVMEMTDSTPDPAAARRKAKRAEKLGFPVPPVFWLKLDAEEKR